MNKYIYAALVIPLAACSSKSALTLDASSARDISSYTLGYQAGEMISNGLSEQKMDKDIFLLGMKDSLYSVGVRHTLPEEEIQALHQEYADFVSEEKRLAAVAQGKKNAVEEIQFLAEYRAKIGTKELESGVLYTVLASGSGNTLPSLNDTVEVHYEGRLPDGTVFDSSYQRGTPVDISLDRVIAGWQHAITAMKEGDRWEIAIPSILAYGETGRAPAISPNQALVFEIELIQIK